MELRVGWKRGGVRGWVHRREAEVLIGARLDESLPLLVKAGDAERVDVREPWRQRPEWIYRLTPQGEETGRPRPRTLPLRFPAPRPDPADAGLFLMPAAHWALLGWLRDERRAGRRGPGAPGAGWFEMRDVTNRFPHALPDDLRALVPRGWVERIPAPGTEGHRTPRQMYRATDRALALELNDAATELFVDLRRAGDPDGAG